MDFQISGPGQYLNALRQRRYNISRGLVVMGMGYLAYMLCLLVLWTSNPSDPRWFVVMVMCLTWISCFIVLAGFTYISCGILARKALKS